MSSWNLSAAGFALAVLLSACSPQSGDTKVSAPAITAADTAAYAEIKPLLEQHCLMCHSEKPAITAYPNAPAGVALETPAQMRRFAPRVVALAAVTHTMPPVSVAAMTDEERKRLETVVRRQWLQDR